MSYSALPRSPQKRSATNLCAEVVCLKHNTSEVFVPMSVQMTRIPHLSTESRIPTVPFSAPQDVGQEAYSAFSEAAGTPCASVQVMLARHIPAATGKLQKDHTEETPLKPR